MENQAVDNANPYLAPKSAVADAAAAEEYQPVKVFSVSGRIGRVRYIGYSIGFALLIGTAMGVLGATVAAIGGRGLVSIVAFAGYAAMFAVQIMLAIQRCHDFNASGWLSLLAIVPLVAIIFWLIPGTDGPNRFGARTPPNSTTSVILAGILPLVFIVGIVAAVAIPAYQDYVKRAQQFQQKR